MDFRPAKMSETPDKDEVEISLKVDKKKLELLILGQHNHIKQSAFDFFHQIEKKFNCTIIYPYRLKLKMLQNKDPYIRIKGTKENLRLVKARVLEFLDVEENRVLLKMDVSFSDHSHIIGVGGIRVQALRDETNCHIHFPDSNLNGASVKSNEVTITGQLENVEAVRFRIRQLNSLILSFDWEIHPFWKIATDVESFFHFVRKRYNVEITIFRKRHDLSSVVVVKGCEYEANEVKKAAKAIIERLQANSSPCSSIAEGQNSAHPITQKEVVVTNMKVTPQQHNFVLGKDNSNLKLIMQLTNTMIMIQDSGDPNIPADEKSTIYIRGAIENVHAAKKMLIGYLPLVLKFEINDETRFDKQVIAKLQNELNLSINFKSKTAFNKQSVVIKAKESNIEGIFKAKNFILGNDEKAKLELIEESYKVQQVISTSSNQCHDSNCIFCGNTDVFNQFISTF